MAAARSCGGGGRGIPFMTSQVQPGRRALLGPSPVVPRIAAWSSLARSAAPPGFEIPQFSMGLTGNPFSKKANMTFRPRTTEEQGHQEKKRSADAMETFSPSDGKGFNPFPPAT